MDPALGEEQPSHSAINIESAHSTSPDIDPEQAATGAGAMERGGPPAGTPPASPPLQPASQPETPKLVVPEQEEQQQALQGPHHEQQVSPAGVEATAASPFPPAPPDTPAQLARAEQPGAEASPPVLQRREPARALEQLGHQQLEVQQLQEPGQAQSALGLGAPEQQQPRTMQGQGTAAAQAQLSGGSGEALDQQEQQQEQEEQEQQLAAEPRPQDAEGGDEALQEPHVDMAPVVVPPWQGDAGAPQQGQQEEEQETQQQQPEEASLFLQHNQRAEPAQQAPGPGQPPEPSDALEEQQAAQALGDGEAQHVQQAQQAGFLSVLEELGMNSTACWPAVREALELECGADARFRCVPPTDRERMFERYTAQQAELEREVEAVAGSAWSQVQADAAAGGLLALNGPTLQLLPASVGQLTSLALLNLGGCTALRCLPASLGCLGHLQFLELAECASLEQLPPSIAELAELQSLDVSGCRSLRELPPQLGGLAALQTLDCSGCAALEGLPAQLGQLGQLRTLNLRDCRGLRRLPESLGRLAGLQWLDLSGCCGLQQLPAAVGQLSSLAALELFGCSQLEELPASIGQLPSLLNCVVAGCAALRALPASLGQAASLQRLYASGCVALRALPDSLGQLSELQALDLAGCTRLKRLPASLAQLTGLQSLNLSGCSSLEELPDLGGCSDLQMSMSDRLPDGGAAKMRRIRVPLRHLPPALQRQQPEVLLDQADAMRQSMTSVSWIAMLLAAASFLGFVTVPGGYLNLGLVQVALRGTQANRAALRTYFIANVCTFFLALATALFVVTEGLPHAAAPTAGRAVFSVVASSLLLLLTVMAGGATFLAGGFSTYPRARYGDLVAAAVGAGAVLLLAFAWYTRRVWRLFFRWRRMCRLAPIPNLCVTRSPPSDLEKTLRSILLK